MGKWTVGRIHATKTVSSPSVRANVRYPGDAMEKYWKIAAGAAILMGIVVVAYQHVEIRDLRKSVLALKRRGPAVESPGPGSDETAALTRRIAELEQTVARVFRMLLSSGRPGPRKGGKAQDLEDAVDTIRQDMDALLTGEALNTDKGRKQLYRIVRRAQEEAWAERRRQWREFRAEVFKQQMRKFADDAGLTERQYQDVTDALSQARTQRRAMFQQVREGTKTYTQAVDEIGRLRQKTNNKLKGILDQKQYEQFTKMRSERRRGFRLF